MDEIRLRELRRDYSSRELSEETIADDPFKQFSAWMAEALNSQIIDANAMTIATVDAQNRPSSRVVLLKGFDADGLVFFTNYESKKAADLAGNRSIALHFFWPQLERQVMINGAAQKTPREESEEYFATRPLESRIGAWASNQSHVLESRAELVKKIAEVRARFEGKDVPCPPFWGGYRVTPDRFEFWQGRESRLHDRIVYILSEGSWRTARLSP
jgi:pyridoxamine 5'-phosphate oxidase